MYIYYSRGKIASLRRVKHNSTLPNPDQNPVIALSKELPTSADLKFVSTCTCTMIYVSIAGG